MLKQQKVKNNGWSIQVKKNFYRMEVLIMACKGGKKKGGKGKGGK